MCGCEGQCDLIVAMSEKHRQILKLKRNDLLRSITVTELLLAALESDSIITKTMREEIKVSSLVLFYHYLLLLAGGGMDFSVGVPHAVTPAWSWDKSMPGSCHKLKWFYYMHDIMLTP